MKTASDDPVRLLGVDVDEVGIPRNDGTAGSALYSVPFKLSREPSDTWKRVFVEVWDMPPKFTSMHRPGIARISGDRVILDGTTIEEVERFHSDTLKLCVSEANRRGLEAKNISRLRAGDRAQKTRQHLRHVAEVAKRLKFDDA